MKRLNGEKGVPKVKATGRWEYGYYLEIELLKTSLYEERERDYSITEINSMTKELIGVLKRIHEHEIIHQDLKPQNIMKDFDGNYVIIDE